MTSSQELRKIAREKNLALDLVEKDYVLGWILYGIYSSRLSNCLAFKGGTALSKVYFPGEWRLSEDLDFTLIGKNNLENFVSTLSDEVPEIIAKNSGVPIVLSKPPFVNSSYLQSRFQYTGPICKNTVKIEISQEKFLGDVATMTVPQRFDYPVFSVKAYTLDNILSEKIRTLIERGKVKDYYDVWKLLKIYQFDGSYITKLFLQKCKTKGITFEGIDQIFPSDIVDVLRPHLEIGLARLSPEPLPPIEIMIAELKSSLTTLLS